MFVIPAFAGMTSILSCTARIQQIWDIVYYYCMFDILNQVLSHDPTGGKFGTIGDFFGVALNVAMGSSIAIATIAIIYAGVQYIMSEGDPKAIASAQKYLTVSVVAFIITIAAFVIKNVILNILGAQGEVTNVRSN